ncbi:MAG TPA: TolC family protein, partial [Ignavibacteriales bacterium]|nr:TolC family protein [Ignavibacteriales bacterium]
MNKLKMLIAFMLLSFGIKAQSLDSLISEALRNNPQLKSIEYKIESAESKAKSVGAWPAPTLGIEFSQVPFEGGNIVNDAISNNLSFSQMFMLGGKLGAMSEAERKNVNVRQSDYASYKTRLIGEIKMAYYNLWLADKKIDVQKRTIDLLNNLLTSLDVLYQTNRVNQADMLTLNGEIASNKTELYNLERERETVVYRLNYLIGRNNLSQDILSPENIQQDFLQYSEPELVEKLTGENPELARMKAMNEMNEAMIRAARKELIPDLMIQGMVMRMPRGMILTSSSDLSMVGMEGTKTEYMYSVMASITLPFVSWSSGKSKHREEELRAEMRGVDYEKENMRRGMVAELKGALSKLNKNKDLIRLYKENVIPSYTQAAEAQVSSFQNNRTNLNSVIDASRMLLMQEM